MNSAHYHQNLLSRKTHHKRFSVSRLSSDTVQTLPEYSSPPGWNGKEYDRPPDYPETADEGDADTEEQDVVYVPQHLVYPLPRRSPSRIRRRKRAPAPAADPFLDTLLERSVHALEMSNALLQSSISTQSSLSALLSPESDSDRFLEVRARNLSTRIRVNSGVHETWMDHLEEISEGVDKLFREEGRNTAACHADDSVVSRSLPTSSARDLRHRRRPSLLELNGSCSSSSHLQYFHPTRDALVAPAPRALTQYVESTADPQLIILPSTLGLRTSGSLHSADAQNDSFAHRQGAQSSQSAGPITESQSDNTTPAYHLLSNLVKQSEPLTPPPSVRLFEARVRRGSASTASTERSTKASPLSTRTVHSSPDRNRSRREASDPRSRSVAPKQLSTSPPRPIIMTPSIEELSPSSSGSTSSSDHPTGYRTVQSLRKILDGNPSSVSVGSVRRKDPRPLRAPSFLPVTPAPIPIQGTSTATASISRLLTKGRHSMSTRAPSPPAHSSLRVRSVPPTPAPSPSTLSLPDVFGNEVARAVGVMGSSAPSNASTPKRISFAELPESYSSSRPGSSKLRESKSKKSRGKKGKDNEKEEPADGWLKTWLSGGLSAGSLGVGGREEKMEERMVRGWGSRPGFGTLDDWAV
ncbi:hypothetical protein PAXRUDRAFT_33733 [Paxillus rubicundulus Ve08.2h10]|uniref:Uncharacterized protein n=1 Tax=Paxillus rubicundulus Ve08.2h10 TaxID=930991 RepID=A0A0D0DW93_9AGAM|nr:hypothetical protein PAXRUDRAFT_33733 [Paxillus rubicundulus Ve08.2h10]